MKYWPGKAGCLVPPVALADGQRHRAIMNVNEVVAYRGHVLKGGKLTDKEKALIPNDDVNKSSPPTIPFPRPLPYRGL